MSSYKMSQKVLNPKAPDRGSFPLDHDGECREFMVRYMACLRSNEMSTQPCRQLSRDYLQCRMDKNLMAPEQWSKLGFADHGESSSKVEQQAKQQEQKLEQQQQHGRGA